MRLRLMTAYPSPETRGWSWARLFVSSILDAACSADRLQLVSVLQLSAQPRRYHENNSLDFVYQYLSSRTLDSGSWMRPFR